MPPTEPKPYSTPGQAPGSDSYLDMLESCDLLPAGRHAVLLTGSRARGWAHATSDIDLIVVVARPVTDSRALHIDVLLDPPMLQVVSLHVGTPRLEVKYWLTDQVEQVLEKVSWERFEHGNTVNIRVDDQEKLLLEFLVTGKPLDGAQWVMQQRKRIGASAFRAFLINGALARCDDKAESALGMLTAGDTHSAVLAAREAFGWAVDAVLVARGEFNLHRKWRARRFRQLAPAWMPFDQYWAVETMRELDPDDPAKWIRGVVQICKDAWLDIDL